MKKSQDGNPGLVVGKPFAATSVPTRSRPFEFLEQVQVVVDKLAPGLAVELDSSKVTEHAARKYLSILAGKDPHYGDFIVRTAPNPGGRRRVFITYPGGISINAPEEPEVQR